MSYIFSQLLTFASMQFSQVLGQSKIKSELWQLHAAGRMPHATLITSVKGGGGLAMGLGLARMLMCESPSIAGACNACAACHKTERWIHPDLHFSFPTIGTNALSNEFLPQWRTFITNTPYSDVFDWVQALGAENKQGNINVQECVSIAKKLSFQVLEGRCKILVLWMPEYLGKEGNRLLKLIEEPPENTFFILVAENTELILQTILSRCQLVKLEPLGQSIIAESLLEDKNLPKAQAEHIAFLANGDYAEALQLIETEIKDDSVFFTTWLRACWLGDELQIMQQVDAFVELGRENQKQFFRYGLQFFRELVVALVAGNKPLKLPNEMAEVARKFASVINFDKCVAICAQLNDDLFYIERNANARVLFTASSIVLHETLRAK
jgi:DNA polymerase III subunit delta'